MCYNRFAVDESGQIVYYESRNLLITSGILVINGTRISVSSIRSVTPTQSSRGQAEGMISLFLFLAGCVVLLIAGVLIHQPEPFPVKWFPGVLIAPLCVPFFYWFAKSIKKIPRPLPAVSISVSEGEIYNLTFADTHAREAFCNALTRAMAERRVT